MNLLDRIRYITIFASLLAIVPRASFGQFGYSRYTSPPTHTEAVVAGKQVRIDD